MRCFDDLLQLRQVIIVLINRFPDHSRVVVPIESTRTAACRGHLVTRPGVGGSDFARDPIALAMSMLLFKLLLALEEVRVHFLDVLIEIGRLQPCDCDVQVCIDNADLVAFVYAEVERLDIIMVGEDAIDLGLGEDVGREGREVIGRDLLVLVEAVGLGQDVDGFLELLKFTHWRLLLLQPARLLDRHLPRVPHLFVDLDVEVGCRQLL